MIKREDFKKVDSGPNLLKETQSPIEPKIISPTVKATPTTEWNQDAGILSYSEIDLPKPRFKNSDNKPEIKQIEANVNSHIALTT